MRWNKAKIEDQHLSLVGIDSEIEAQGLEEPLALYPTVVVCIVFWTSPGKWIAFELGERHFESFQKGLADAQCSGLSRRQAELSIYLGDAIDLEW